MYRSISSVSETYNLFIRIIFTALIWFLKKKKIFCLQCSTSGSSAIELQAKHAVAGGFVDVWACTCFVLKIFGLVSFSKDHLKQTSDLQRRQWSQECSKVLLLFTLTARCTFTKCFYLVCSHGRNFYRTAGLLTDCLIVLFSLIKSVWLRMCF